MTEHKHSRTGRVELLAEIDRLEAELKTTNENLTNVQTRCTELLEENRALKKTKFPLVCSFCRKTQREVATLIAGPGVFICDECVSLSEEIVKESQELNGQASKSRGSDQGSANPCEGVEDTTVRSEVLDVR